MECKTPRPARTTRDKRCAEALQSQKARAERDGQTPDARPQSRADATIFPSVAIARSDAAQRLALPYATFESLRLLFRRQKVLYRLLRERRPAPRFT